MSMLSTISVVFYPGVNGALGVIAGHTAKNYSVPQSYIDGDITHDYGLFSINSNIGKDRGYFGWSTSASVGTTVQIAGYPCEHPNELWLAGKQIKKVTTNQLYYDVDATGGQSGSPVYTNPNQVVTAIHTYGTSSSVSYNSGTRINVGLSNLMSTYR